MTETPRCRHLLALAFAALGAACSKEAPPAAEEPRTPHHEAAADTRPTVAAASAAVAPAAPPTGAATGPAKIAEDNFDLELASVGAWSAGQRGEVSVTLRAKGSFHCNKDYPYKLTLADTPDVEFESNPVTKEAAKIDEKVTVVTFGVKPRSAGKKKIGGKFAFSICTDDKCLIEKRDLSVDVDVK